MVPRALEIKDACTTLGTSRPSPKRLAAYSANLRVDKSYRGHFRAAQNLLIQRASWTLIDQGVVSFGNFLLNVLLARTLSEEDYGKFALFLGAIFILRTIDYSLIYLSAVGAPLRRQRRGARRLLGNTILLSRPLVSSWSWSWHLEPRF